MDTAVRDRPVPDRSGPAGGARRPLLAAGAVLLVAGLGSLGIGVLDAGSRSLVQSVGLPSGSPDQAAPTGVTGATATPTEPGAPSPTGVATATPAAAPATPARPDGRPPTGSGGSGHVRGGHRAVRPSAKPTAAKKAVPVAPAGTDLALGRPVTTTSSTQDYVASNANDGDLGTYWEGAPGFPQQLTVDLGSVTTIGRMRLTLPGDPDWNRRVQTIAVYGSTDGVHFHRIAGATGYAFDANSPAEPDTVSTSLPTTAARYVRLSFSANSGWKAAQLSELQLHSS